MSEQERNTEYRIWLKGDSRPLRLAYEGIREWLKTPEMVDRVECRALGPWYPTMQSLWGPSQHPNTPEQED